MMISILVYIYDGVFECVFGKSFHLYSSRRWAFKITTNDQWRTPLFERNFFFFFEILSVRRSSSGGGTLFQKWLAVKPWQVNGLTWFRNEIKNWTPASPHGILTSNVTCILMHFWFFLYSWALIRPLRVT